MTDQPVLTYDQITIILARLTEEVRSLAAEVQTIQNTLAQVPAAPTTATPLEPERYATVRGGVADRDSKTSRFLATVHQFPNQWVLWGIFAKETVAKATLYKRRSIHTDLLFRIVKVTSSGTEDYPGTTRYEVVGMLPTHEGPLPEACKGEEE